MKIQHYKMQNPKESICFLLFPEPKKIEDICMILYGKKRNSRISQWIKELHESGLIKEHKKINGKIMDGRCDYYQTTSKALIEHIEINIKKFNQFLNENEKEILKKIFDSSYFRNTIKNLVPKELIKFTDLSAIKYYIHEKCTMLFFLEYYREQNFSMVHEGVFSEIYEELSSNNKSIFNKMGNNLISKLTYINPEKTTQMINDYLFVSKFVSSATKAKINYMKT